MRFSVFSLRNELFLIKYTSHLRFFSGEFLSSSFSEIFIRIWFSSCFCLINFLRSSLLVLSASSSCRSDSFSECVSSLDMIVIQSYRLYLEAKTLMGRRSMLDKTLTLNPIQKWGKIYCFQLKRTLTKPQY
jgi:hypothetical protein